MRKEDPKNGKKSFFRSRDRIFKLSEAWYFGAREGDQGPFRTRDRAILEVSRYVAERIDLHAFQKSRETHRPRSPFGMIVGKRELTLVPIEEATNGNLALETDSEPPI